MDQLQDGKDNETTISRPNRLQAVLHFVLGLLFLVGCLFLLGTVAFALASYFVNGKVQAVLDMTTLVKQLYSHPFVLKLFFFVSSSLPLIIAAVLAIYFIKATPKEYLLLHFPKSMKWFIVSVIFVFLCVPLMGPLLEINQLLDLSRWPEIQKWLSVQDASNNETYEAMVGDKGALSFISSILFMAALPAIAEEVFFRGFLMNVFNGMFKNMHVAIVVTAVIFSLVHVQFMKILPMFFLAVVFGYVAYWTGSIWTSITAHFINNSLAIVQLYFYTDGDYDKVLNENLDLPAIAFVGLTAIVVGSFVYLQKNSSTKTENFYV